MKKGDKPKDLDKDWWSKNKAKTLKSTGLGKALAEYAKVRAGAHSLKYFDDCRKELTKVLSAVDKAKKACNDTLHAETKEALGHYPAVVTKEMNEISKDETDYTKRLSIFKTSREKLVVELQKIEVKVSSLIEKVKSEYKKLEGVTDAKQIKAKAGPIHAACEQVVSMVDDAILKCKPWREGEAPYNQGTLDAGDRDGAGGTKTLTTINPLMVTLGDHKKDAARIGEEAGSIK